MAKLLGLMTLIMIIAASPSRALDLIPFQVRNLSPTALVHGLSIAETPNLLQAGTVTANTRFDLANHATLNTHDSLNAGGGESIHLDGETYVATLGVRYGITDQLQVGIDLPWVWHSRGVMDGFINDWHDFFGFPNGDRDTLKNDQLDYLYTRDGEERLRRQDEVDGVGDLRLQLAWQFKRTDQSAFTLQAQAKAPTGDAHKLTGSEAWDLSLALSSQRDFPLGDGRGALWGGVGVSWLGDGEVLAEDVEDFAANGWLGAGWSPLEWLALKVQIDSHSALYDSDLGELGEPAVILTMGGALALGENTLLEIGVGEDLNVNASPDVTFHLNLAYSF